MKTYTVESFNTGTRQTVHADDWHKALESIEGDHFTVVRKPNGQFMAACLPNNAFPIAGGHCADTPTAAADSIRQHYCAISAVVSTHNPR